MDRNEIYEKMSNNLLNKFEKYDDMTKSLAVPLIEQASNQYSDIALLQEQINEIGHVLISQKNHANQKELPISKVINRLQNSFCSTISALKKLIPVIDDDDELEEFEKEFL